MSAETGSRIAACVGLLGTLLLFTGEMGAIVTQHPKFLPLIPIGIVLWASGLFGIRAAYRWLP